ncbi:hypothetical protein BaRGS_00033862, partial [Batillaria attramentaria]
PKAEIRTHGAIIHSPNAVVVDWLPWVPDEEKAPYNYTESGTARMRRRQKEISDYCETHVGFESSSSTETISLFRKASMISRKHKLLYCPVGKVASTFLTRFLIAAEETKPVLSPFSISPQKAMRVRQKHGDRGAVFMSVHQAVQTRTEKDFLNNLKRVLFVRSPYERLWSAYVDKLIYPNRYYWEEWGIPAMTMLYDLRNLGNAGGYAADHGTLRKLATASHRNKQNAHADNGLRFLNKSSGAKNFLGNFSFFGDFVNGSFHQQRRTLAIMGDALRTQHQEEIIFGDLMNPREGDVSECGQSVLFPQFIKFVLKELHKTDTHVRPIHLQCAPCYVNYDVIGHVETMASDFSHMLDVLNISIQSHSGLDWDKAYAKDVIKEGVDNLFTKWLPELTECISKESALKRLWRVLQIRGIISEDESYPFTGSDISKLEANTVEQELLFARDRSRDKEGLRRQKVKAFIESYQSLDKRDLKELQRIYRTDFEMFGYDHHLP